MASNIVSTGNLTIAKNFVCNSDNTTTTIINGLTTINNNLVVNGNINSDDFITDNIHTNYIVNTETITTKNIINTSLITTPFINCSNFMNSDNYGLNQSGMYISKIGSNQMIYNSPSIHIFNINFVEKLRINSTGITTPILTSTNINNSNLITTNSLTCSGTINCDVLNCSNLGGEYYTLTYPLIPTSLPVFPNNAIGYREIQYYGPIIINNNNVINTFYKQLITGVYTIYYNFRIEQFYNIENSIYSICFAGNNTQIDLFGYSNTHYMGSLIQKYYNGCGSFQFTVSGDYQDVYTNIKIQSNNYTTCTLQLQVIFLRNA